MNQYWSPRELVLVTIINQYWLAMRPVLVRSVTSTALFFFFCVVLYVPLYQGLLRTY